MINFEILNQAKKKTTLGAWGYLVGGADDELTLLRNRMAYQAWGFTPTVGVDVSKLDLSSKLLGIPLDVPYIAAPIGGLTQFHPDGETEWARGLKQSGILGVLSGVSRIPATEVIRESKANLLFQVYWFGDETWVRGQINEAENAGYQAVVVTVDTAYYGNRERDLLAKYDPRTSGRKTTPEPQDRTQNTKLNWRQIAKVREWTKLPLVIKGVTTAEDVRRSVEVGAKAVWISNHGGRQLDYSCATLDVLQTLAPVCKDADLEVIFDGGIRRGAEALIALALGADVVAVGRLPIFGLVCEGAAGVQAVFKNFRTEFETSMGLAGITSVSQIASRSSSLLKPAQPIHQVLKWDQVELGAKA